MKDLIRKVLREEVSRRFSSGTSEKRDFIIKRLEDLLSETTRVIPPLEENYGIHNEEWCKNGKVVMEARYHVDEDTDEFFSGDLFIDQDVIEFLSKMLQVRKPFILNVVTEWYDENYASKFGPEVNHPEFEIFETFETDTKRKCYQMINMDDISRKEMVDYLDKETGYRRNELEELPEDELKSRYRSVYNSRLNGIGNRNPT
jgi:hypothetical protein